MFEAFFPTRRGVDEVDKKYDQQAYRRIVASQRILRNRGRNNNSPTTGLRQAEKNSFNVIHNDLANYMPFTPLRMPLIMTSKLGAICPNALTPESCIGSLSEGVVANGLFLRWGKMVYSTLDALRDS